jgi:RNA polymerase sigma-B factor
VGTEDRMLLAISLAQLPERERTILNLRFVDGLTQSEIAERVGISQMHVSRLLAASLSTLRESVVGES